MKRVLLILWTTAGLAEAASPANDAFARSLIWVSNLSPREMAAQDQPVAPAALPLVLQLRILDGEGVVYGLGSRATHGITVQVTDETGHPVAGAAVSFVLPNDGPSGTFENGAKAEVVVTKSDGRAAVWGMRWNKTAGQVEVRITALKDPARAGAVTHVVLSPKVAAAQKSPTEHAYHNGKRWTTILLVAAGVAGAGLAAGLVAGNNSTPAFATVSTAPKIGTPSIILGKP